MKHILKRGISILLAIAIIFSSAYAGLNELDFAGLFAVEAEAADTDYLEFELNEDEASYSVVGYNENAYGVIDIVIPETFNGLPVTGIDNWAFDGLTTVDTITIPASVTDMDSGGQLFVCSVSSIIVDEGNPVFSSENGVLYNKDKTELVCVPYGYNERVFTIPSTVTKIKSYAIFFTKNIDVVFIPDTVKCLEDCAVYSPNIEFVSLGKGIEEIGYFSIFIGGSVFIPDEITEALLEFNNGTAILNLEFFPSANIYYSGTCDNMNKLVDSGVVYYDEVFEKYGSKLYCDFNPIYKQTDKYFYIESGNQIDVCAYWGNEKEFTVPEIIDGKAVKTFFPHVLVDLDALEEEDWQLLDFDILNVPVKFSNILDVAQLFGNYIFRNLKAINIIGDNPDYSSADGVLFNKDKTALILYPMNKSDDTYAIPDGVTTIKEEAFAYCYNLKNVTIPDSVINIGGNAFYSCDSLASVEISDNVTSIENSTFSDCTSLTSVVIPSSVTSIDSYAFCDCISLASVEFSEGLISIGASAFSGCEGLSSVVIPSSVTSIDSYAFRDCMSLTSIEIPDSVTSIGGYAFNGTAYYNNEENWENGVLYIDAHLIKAKADISGSYTVKSGTKTIASDAFNSCNNITAIEIPYGVRNIGYSAFDNCYNLTTISLPASLKDYNDYDFYNCPKLTTINVHENSKQYSSENGVLFNKNKTELLKYPQGKTAESYVIPSTVTAIGSSAFRYCDNLTSVVIPDGVTGIGASAFSECDNLTSVEIPYSVTSIGDSAFYDCYSLTSIEIPDGVTSIGYKTFSYCYSLTSIEIPDSVTSIGYSSFSGCSKLTSIKIPDSVTSIGNYAFASCDKLTSIEIPDSVTSIGSSAFSGCSKLTSIKIPDSVTSIGDDAFSGCYNLTSIEIPDSVTSIGGSVLRSCNNLRYAKIGSGISKLPYGTFSSCGMLEAIVIPESVEKIECSFDGNENLKYVFYSGSEEKGQKLFKNIGLSSDVIIHYNSIGHTIENGICDICGKECNHIYSDAVCNLCGKVCAHSDYVNGACSECGYGCEHSYENGVCSVCGYECNHNFVNCVCSICGSETVFESAHPYPNGTNTWVINRPGASYIYVTFSSDTRLSTTSGTAGSDRIYICDENDKQVGCYYGTGLAGKTIKVYGETVKIKLVGSYGNSRYYGFRVTDISYVGKCDVHNFVVDNERSYAQTCTEDGLSVKICSVCETEEKTVIPATGHKHILSEEDSFDATCTEDGVISKICCYCGDEITETIPATGHNYVLSDEVVSEPTCTEDGVGMEICSVCGGEKTVSIPATGHNYVNEICEKCGHTFFEYTVSDEGEITITKYRGNNFVVSIPSTIKGYPVVAIDDYAFCSGYYWGDFDEGEVCYGEYVELIEIPATVKYISENAFPDYWDLWDDTYCSLAWINVSEENPNYSSVDGVLYNKDKTKLLYVPVQKYDFSLEIPDTVKEITRGAFNSEIDFYIIPKGVEKIDFYYAGEFDVGCVYEGTYDEWYEKFGYDEEAVYPLYCEAIGIGECTWDLNLPYYAPDLRYIVKKDGTAEIVRLENYNYLEVIIDENYIDALSVEIPSVVDGYTVTAIGDSAFYGRSFISDITIPETVKSIGKYAFYSNDNLEAVTLPDSLVSIGADAFTGTAYYENWENWENNALYIGNHLIDVKESLKGTFKVSGNTIVIADEAFKGVWINEIDVHSSSKLYKTEDGVLFNKDMTELIAMPEGALSDGDTYVIPETVTSLKDCAFYGSQFERLVFPSSMTKINGDAFGDEFFVDGITIPLALKEINGRISGVDYVFYEGGTEDKSKIKMEEDESGLNESIWHYYSTDHTDSDWIIDKTSTTHEMGSKHKECTVCGCETITERIPLLSGLNFVATNMSSYKLASYDGIKTDLTIPATHNNCAVTAIGNGCFKDNSEIERIVVPVGATEIGYLAFANCKSLKVVSIPATVTSIGMQAFYGFTGTIYCQKDSVAHKYAVENGIDFIIPTIEPNNDKTRVDFDEQIVFTTITGCRNIDELLDTPTTVISLPVASQVTNTGEIYGTGSTITVFDGNKFMGDYTLIVEGDLNGDGTCDVGDAAIAYLYSVDMEEATENQVLAANGCVSDELDAQAYQNVINRCLAS